MPNNPRSITAIDIEVCRRLSARRKQLRLTQKQIARKLNITAQQIHKYETGKNRLTLGRLLQFIEILDTSIDYFLHDLIKTPAQLMNEKTNPHSQAFVSAFNETFISISTPEHRIILDKLAKIFSKQNHHQQNNQNYEV